MASKNNRSGPDGGQVRCGIYTRKSKAEGLDSDFSTLDAQRESCEHYIRAHAAQGWEVVPERYDDGGYTGANMDRPALQELLDDVDRGKVDVVVTYKVDRLSRSLLDFARLMERLDAKGVSFVSITQQFDTSTSMGRLILNVLLSFAQFEREMIAERTRDKVLAARRRGKWTGGHPVLGYGLDAARRGLAVIEVEANLVRFVFDLYLQSRSIDVVAEKLNTLGYTQKRRTTKAGKTRGGGRWNRNAVYGVLRNPLYVGKVRGKDGALFPGEHESIVDLATFEAAAESLDGRTTGTERRSRTIDYLLAGLIRCGPCGTPMWPSKARGRGGREYRYYRCRRHQGKAAACPTKLLPAEGVEQVVVAQVAQVAQVARREEIRRRVIDRLAAGERAVPELGATRDRLQAQIVERNAEAKRLLAALGSDGGGGRLVTTRLGELEVEMDRLRADLDAAEERLRGVEEAARRAERVAALLESFDDVWDVLVQQERCELVRLVIRDVVVDRQSAGLCIGFHDLGTPAMPSSPVRSPS